MTVRFYEGNDMAIRGEYGYGGDHVGKCTLCGKASAAYWVGSVGEIEICRPCAEQALPGLLADAMGSSEQRRRQLTYEGTLNVFLMNYWKFVAKLVGRKPDVATAVWFRDVEFRTPLEAQWAAFFDLVNWHWQYMPPAVSEWQPTFFVRFPCSHSECNGSHSLLLAVKPYSTAEQFEDHPCLRYAYGEHSNSDAGSPQSIPADAGAAFGDHPDHTWWEMGHGAGGGAETVSNWITEDLDELWERARAMVRAHP